MLVYSENLACFVFLKHPFWDSPFWPFWPITDELQKKKKKKRFLETKKIRKWLFPEQFQRKITVYKQLWNFWKDIAWCFE